MPYFIFTTTYQVSDSVADRINERIKQLDSTAVFVGPVSIPGNTIRGWIERPNDGSNDYNFRRAINARLSDIAKDELGIPSEKERRS